MGTLPAKRCKSHLNILHRAGLAQTPELSESVLQRPQSSSPRPTTALLGDLLVPAGVAFCWCHRQQNGQVPSCVWGIDSNIFQVTNDVQTTE